MGLFDAGETDRIPELALTNAVVSRAGGNGSFTGRQVMDLDYVQPNPLGQQITGSLDGIYNNSLTYSRQIEFPYT